MLIDGGIGCIEKASTCVYKEIRILLKTIVF